MSKKKIVSLFIGGILAIGLIGGSFAWFTSKDSITNAFETVNFGETNNMESGVKIEESFDREGAKNMIPGATKKKEVKIKNTANYNQFIRVKIDKVWKYKGEIVTHYIEKIEKQKDEHGNDKEVKKYEYLTKEQASSNKKAIPLDESLIVLNFNKDHLNNLNNMRDKWTNVKDLGEDNGWFYYIARVVPNGETNLLLDSVTLSLDASIVYKSLAFDVVVTAESVQDANSALDDVWGDIPSLVKNAMIKYQI